MQKIKLSLLLILATTLQLFSQENIILKISPFHGEKYVTKLTDVSAIKTIFKKDLESKGYSVYTSTDEILKGSNSQMVFLYLDVFVYQFPADYPSITIALRNDSNTLYGDNDNIKIFGDRQKANEKVARKILDRFPLPSKITENSTASTLALKRKDIPSIYTLASNSLAKGQSKKYIIEVEKEANSTLQFEYGIVEEFISNLINFAYFRNKVRGKKIKLSLEIDAYGFTSLIDKEIPSGLSPKNIKVLESVADGFPLWGNLKRKKETMTLIYGTH